MCTVQDIDFPCTVCAKQSCCKWLSACDENQDCACVSSCVLAQNQGLEPCLNKCGLENAIPTAWIDVASCMGEKCKGQCG